MMPIQMLIQKLKQYIHLHIITGKTLIYKIIIWKAQEVSATIK